MSALAETTCRGASSLAPAWRYPTASATTTEHTDGLARRQLHTAFVQPPELKCSVSFRIGSQTVKLTYYGTKLPPWAEPTLRSLSERWGIGQGWDSYDAKPTEPQLAARLLNCLSGVMNDNSVAPVVTPLSDGGLQAEWHRNNQDIEIVVPANEPVRYYYCNSATQREEEEELNQERVAHVRALIENI